MRACHARCHARCHGVASLACMLALAALLILAYIQIVEKMTKDDFSEELEPMPEADTMFLYDLTNFSYVIEQPDCSDKWLAILLITSRVDHVELRSAHRRGYPEPILTSLGIRRIFLLALQPSKSAWQQSSIEDEARRFKDILQGNFNEAYRHLTYKNTMGLLWAARQCRNSSFIAKMDDDIAVNVFELVKVIREEIVKGSSRLAGSVIKGNKPQRNQKGKWFLTEEEFAGDVFPDYLSGWLYFGRTALLGRLAHNASATQKYLFIDDLLLLGIVREKVLGKRTPFLELNSRISKDVVTVRCCLLKPKTSCHLIAGPVDHDERLLLRFIRHATKCSTRGACLPPPEKVINCGTDVRALVEDALAPLDESSTGVASAVPL